MKKYRTLTNEERLEIANKVANKTHSIAFLSRQYDVSRDTIEREAKRKKELEDGILQEDLKPKGKRKRLCNNQVMEQKLVKWLEIIRIWKFPVTKSLIQAKAIQIHSTLQQQHGSSEEKIKEFHASDGWFDRFKHRFKIRSCKIVDESGSSKVEECKEQLDKLGREMENFDPENIYNVDEAALFFKMLPNFTYCLPPESNVRGTKQSKDRVTVIFCCNLTGSHKILPTMIGTSKKPHCFNRVRPPIPYYNSPTAWINSKIFYLWFTEVFQPSVRSRTSAPILLILDNYSCHNIVMNVEKNIVIRFLPANVTSTSQPLDQGIISTVKRNYRIDVLKQVIDNLDGFIENLRLSRKKSGLNNGGLPDILDAAIIVNSSWNKISPETILKCWIRSNIVPSHMVAALRNSIDSQNKSMEGDEEIDSICNQLINSNLNILEINVEQSKKNIILKEDVQQWFNMEMDPNVVMDVVEEQLKDDLEDNIEEKSNYDIQEFQQVDESCERNELNDSVQLHELCTKLQEYMKSGEQKWRKSFPQDMSFDNFIKRLKSIENTCEEEIREVNNPNNCLK